MKKEFKIDGMSCNHCVMAVQKSLAKLNLKKSEVEIGSAIIDFDQTSVSDEDIIKSINNAGYRIKAINILNS